MDYRASTDEYMNHEMLSNLSSREVRDKLEPITPTDSYTSLIANELGRVVVGQEEALNAVARRVTLAESGMNDPDRPLSTMLFLGQTGTGKTETSHALAGYLFNDEYSEQLKIIDCSEYSERHMVTRLTGAPPSYVGYGADTQITEKFLSNRNIIVWDEIEKADPALHRLLLGIIESGRLRVKNGNDLNFANSYMIMTSNIGASELHNARKGVQNIGFGGGSEQSNLDEIGKNALKKHFKHMPEFLGRIDETIVFNDLKPEHYDLIFNKFVKQKNNQMKERLQNKAPFIAVTNEARAYLLSTIDTEYGARDIRKTVDQKLFQRIADLFMQINLEDRPIVADVEDNDLVFYTDKIEDRPPDPEPIEVFNPLRVGLEPIPLSSYNRHQRRKNRRR